jgi:hypothetical protein
MRSQIHPSPVWIGPPGSVIFHFTSIHQVSERIFRQYGTTILHDDKSFPPLRHAAYSTTIRPIPSSS